MGSADIEEIRQGEAVIVAPHGKLDTRSEAAFEAKLKALLEEHARFLVVDFGEVDFVSGGALRALLLTTRRLRARGGKLVLCRVSGDVHQAFTISGFDRVFEMVGSRVQAVYRATGRDVRISRVAALALPLLAGGHDGAAGGAQAFAADPRPSREGLGDLVCRVLSAPSS